MADHISTLGCGHGESIPKEQNGARQTTYGFIILPFSRVPVVTRGNMSALTHLPYLRLAYLYPSVYQTLQMSNPYPSILAGIADGWSRSLSLRSKHANFSKWWAARVLMDPSFYKGKHDYTYQLTILPYLPF
jgi:hypothetical protein